MPGNGAKAVAEADMDMNQCWNINIVPGREFDYVTVTVA